MKKTLIIMLVLFKSKIKLIITRVIQIQIAWLREMQSQCLKIYQIKSIALINNL